MPSHLSTPRDACTPEPSLRTPLCLPGATASTQGPAWQSPGPGRQGGCSREIGRAHV